MDSDERGIRKEERRKKRKKIKRVFLIILAIAVVVAGFFAFSENFCKLTDLSIDGIENSDPQQVTDVILSQRFPDNAMYMFLYSLIEKPSNPEFVDSIKFSMTDLGAIHAQVTEKEVSAYLTDEEGKYVYVDKNGTVSAVSARLIEGVLPITGIVPYDPVVGSVVTIGDRERRFYIEVLDELEVLGLEPNEIQFDENGYITVCLDEYDISVGNDNLLSDKMARLEYIIPEIEGMRGTLHLETFSVDNTDIVFEKATVTVEEKTNE